MSYIIIFCLFVLVVFLHSKSKQLKLDVSMKTDRIRKLELEIQGFIDEKTVLNNAIIMRDSSIKELQQINGKLTEDASVSANRIKTYSRDIELLRRNNAKIGSDLIGMKDKYSTIELMNKEILLKESELNEILGRLSRATSQYSDYEYGVFHPVYKFEHVARYKEALLVIEEAQRVAIRNGSYMSCLVPELAESPIIKSLKKLTIRFLNSEINSLVDSANAENLQGIYKRLDDLYKATDEILEVLSCRIEPSYFDLAVKKIQLSVEYENLKSREKEEQAEIKRMLREEEDARIEAEELLEKAKAEEAKFNEALAKANEQLKNAAEDELDFLREKVLSLEQQVAEAKEVTERAVSLAQITRAGHVYVISNIGSFGENVFKVGLTRRQNPMERVKELGDASVPFEFDVHALIKCDDAPLVETTIHKALNDKRINKVNNRKEFFRVSIDEIEKVCFEMGLHVNLTKLAEASSYRASCKVDETAA